MKKLLKLTPKRRRTVLKPNSVKAWVGTFVRRDPGAAPMQLDEIVNRYLEDTRAGGLRNDSASMEALRQGIAQALSRVWDIGADGQSLVSIAQLQAFMKMGGKACFTIPSATVLNIGSGFSHKELCDRGTITGGTACMYSCAYCSVGATMFRSPDTAILRLLEIAHGDAIIRRLDPGKILRGQLTYKDGTPRYKGKGGGVVILSPIVDPLPSIGFLEESLELVLLIMELTDWDVRVLTKSMLVRKLAALIPAQHRHRIIYGLSLGTLDDGIGKVIEKLTSLPSKRLEAYHELQKQGLRTYSMHCPVLPQADYQAYAQRLAAVTNWGRDEHVWVEALNSRGESTEKTISALRTGGFNREADLLTEATRSHVAWEFGYNRPLFEAMASVCPPEKLRYLVYAGDADRDYWLGQRDRGAVVLGKDGELENSDE